MDPTTLHFSNLNGPDRKQLHAICDIMKLDHTSEGADYNRRVVVERPQNWSWEFGEGSKYPKPFYAMPGYDGKRRKKRDCFYCDNCGQDEGQVDILLQAPFLDGLYCDKCVEEFHQGGMFSDRKWEQGLP